MTPGWAPLAYAVGLCAAVAVLEGYRRDLRPVVREMYVEDAEGGAQPRDYIDPDPAQQVEGDEGDGGRGAAPK